MFPCFLVPAFPRSEKEPLILTFVACDVKGNKDVRYYYHSLRLNSGNTVCHSSLCASGAFWDLRLRKINVFGL
jgi:hypothetical protein